MNYLIIKYFQPNWVHFLCWIYSGELTYFSRYCQRDILAEKILKIESEGKEALFCFAVFDQQMSNEHVCCVFSTGKAILIWKAHICTRVYERKHDKRICWASYAYVQFTMFTRSNSQVSYELNTKYKFNLRLLLFY